VGFRGDGSLGADPPFVDREKELAALTNLLKSNAFTPIIITGADGVGKTRLTEEFVRRAKDLVGEGEVIAIWIGEDVHIPKVYSTNEKIAEIVVDALKAVAEVGLRAVGLESIAQLAAIIIDHFSEVLKDLIARRLPKRELYVVVGCNCLDGIRASEVAGILRALYDAARRIRADHVMLVTSANWEKLAATDTAEKLKYTVRMIGPLDRAVSAELYHKLKAMYPRSKYSELEVWQISGGNPQVMIDAMRGDLPWHFELRANVAERELRRAAKKIPNILDDVLRVVKNPDSLKEYPMLGGLLVYKLGVVVPRNEGFFLGADDGEPLAPPPDPARGIGSQYMWRSPEDRKIMAVAVHRVKMRHLNSGL